MITSHIENLIHKYVTRSSDTNDIDELAQWVNESNNENIFKSYVRTHYIITKSMNNPSSDKITKELIKKIRKDKSILNRFNFKSVLKYAAVILLTLFLGYFFKDDFEGRFNDERGKIVVDHESITLKLGDGSVKIINESSIIEIVDKKGNVIGSQKGKRLVYNGTNESNKLVYNELKVPYGKRFDITLSDGTNVFLNAGTSIKYPIKFLPGKTRQVYLNGGEAFFDVTKDTNRPFKINAQELNVEVLGTKFNMTVYPEDVNYEVVLVEGSVKMNLEDVLNNEQEGLVLRPSFKGSFNKDSKSISSKRVNTSIYTSWMDGNIVFRNATFNNIIRKLERHYNVTIINNNMQLSQEFFNATIEVDKETIEEVLNYFNKVYQIEYSIVNNKIIIN